MTNRQLAEAILVSGAGSLAIISFLDPTWWEIAAAFPAGALAFLLVWVLGEKLEVPRGRS